MWFEQKVCVVLFAVLQGTGFFFLRCPYCLHVCTSASVYAHTFVCWCMTHNATFASSQRHKYNSHKVRAAGANEALRFAKLRTHGIQSICLSTDLRGVRFFLIFFIKICFVHTTKSESEVGKKTGNQSCYVLRINHHVMWPLVFCFFPFAALLDWWTDVK